MNMLEHCPDISPLNAAAAEFERKFQCMHAETIDDVANWYTHQSGGAEMRLRAVDENGPVATVSNKKLGGFDLRVFNWGIPVHGLSVSDTSIITINIALTGTRTVQDQYFGNISWQNNEAGIYKLDAGTTVVSDRPHSLLHLTLPTELLEARARSIYDKELNEPLRFSPVINLSREGAAIGSLFGYLLAQTVSAPDALRSPAVESSFRELVVSTVFGTLKHNYGQALSTKVVDCVRPRMVKRAEDYMQAHAEEPISLQILAREAGCSERALQDAFKSFRSMTPMGALREIRLEKARQDLKEAADTVTGIAFKWGFSNPGRFAAQYAERFGETPSQTHRACRFEPNSSN